MVYLVASSFVTDAFQVLILTNNTSASSLLAVPDTCARYTWDKQAIARVRPSLRLSRMEARADERAQEIQPAASLPLPKTGQPKRHLPTGNGEGDYSLQQNRGQTAEALPELE